jgi:hypothetical protein
MYTGPKFEERIEELIVYRLPIPASQIFDLEKFLAERDVFLAHFSDDPKLVYSVSKYPLRGGTGLDRIKSV